MTTNDDALAHRIRHAHRRATGTEWCLEENCEYRHWTSGGVPTHRRGSTCPPMPTLEAAVLPVIAAEVQAAKAEAWDEAYRYGVDDARIADDLRVDVGLGPDLYAQPARQNPYRATEYETGDRA